MEAREYDIERNIEMRVLSDEARAYIDDAALTVLETIGMKVSGERILARFAEKGIYPDKDGVIFIPREIVASALKTVPHELKLYTVGGQPSMVIDKTNRVYFGTHADQLELVDYKTNKARRFLLRDVELMCKLASNLENIDFVLSVGMMDDVPPKVQSQVSFIEACKYMRKTINFSTNDIDALQQIIDIAAIVAGGKERLAEKPFIFNYCEPIPPLTHPIESTEKLYISAENMIPVVYMPYCMMGGTAPLDKPAALAQCFAEILAGLVISQLSKEGAPFIVGSMPSIMDMKTTIGSYAAPEFHLMIAASAEMADYYNLPFYGTAACSDAKTIDPQSIAEISYELMLTMLSKANLIHDVGVLDHCNSVSPAAVVLANEMINSYKKICSGVPIKSRDDIDLSLISDVGHAKHYMGEINTLMRFKEIWYPEIFSRRMVNPDESDILEKVTTKIESIMRDDPGPALSEELLAKLNGIQQEYLNLIK